MIIPSATIINFFVLINFGLITYNFLVLLINLVSAERFNSKFPINSKKVTEPFVSVLIPARNEEKNISNLLSDLFAQDYRNFEIIVLDDNSTDNTAQIIKELTTNKRNTHKITLNLLRGKALPTGWRGKNWACQQLSLEAKGEFLLFIDADTRLAPKAISLSIEKIKDYKALSVFPTQIMESWGEKITIPIISWFLLAFLPLIIANKTTISSLTAANGQFMLFEKRTYKLIRGHESVKTEIVEDIKIFKKLRSAGYKTITLIDDGIVRCRMYRNYKESFMGIAKNIDKLFLPNKFIFTIFTTLVINCYLFIPLLLFFILNSTPTYFAHLSHILITWFALIILINTFTGVVLKLVKKEGGAFQPFLQVFVLFNFGLVAISAITNNFGRGLFWKGRKV